MRISDWSSDVCSSDLTYLQRLDGGIHHLHRRGPQRFSRRKHPIQIKTTPLMSFVSWRQSSEHFPGIMRKFAAVVQAFAAFLAVHTALGKTFDDPFVLKEDLPFIACQDRKSTRLNSSH